MGIGNFGLTEIAAIVVLVLIFFGPKELPEIIRTLARVFRDLRRSVNEVVREFDDIQRVDENGGGQGGRRDRERAPRPGERVLPPEAREQTRGGEDGGDPQGESRGEGPAPEEDPGSAAGPGETPTAEGEAGAGPGMGDGSDDRT